MSLENGNCNVNVDEIDSESNYVENVFAVIDAFERSEDREIIQNLSEEVETEGNLVGPAAEGLKKLLSAFPSQNMSINAALVALNDPDVLAAVMCYYERHPDLMNAIKLWGCLQTRRDFE